MRYDLVSLRIFVAVAECGNLTRAAEREHLAVSAISKRIGELEAQSGTSLLQRYPRGVALTPAGQALLGHARQVLQALQRMEVDLAGYADGVKGHVRLHAVASALTQFLPEELESFLSRYPLVQVSLVERTGRAIVQAVTDGSADVGVISSPVPATGLSVRPYHLDRLMLGVPADHPLAGRTGVRFAEALDYAFVGPQPDSSLALLMADGARACGKPVQQRIQASGFDAMCRLVETRLGITMLPQAVLQAHATAGRISVVPLDDDWALRQLFIVFREQPAPGPIAQTLVEHLQLCAAPTRG